MKQILNVDLNTSYKITVSDDNISDMMQEVLSLTASKKRLFVISEKVYKIYKSTFNFSENEILVLRDGEAQKNLKNYTKIIQKAVEIGLTRKDALIAVGGGVIGDITGFAASTYMRGIEYIQIPTTLLSMVDSSVGGKTAIDVDSAKNIIGTFYQPAAVFVNINFLKTLDNRQYMSGIGEILKYAFIENNCNYKHTLFLFEYLTLCSDKLLNRESMTLFRVIDYCLNLKLSVVIQDEKEAGLRKVLNLGHTYGHAIEVLGKYKKYLHGEAVVQGLYFIFNYAYSKNIISYSYYRLATELLQKYGFKSIKTKFKSQDIIEVMKHDKKATQDKILFVIPCDKKLVKEIMLSEEEIFQEL